MLNFRNLHLVSRATRKHMILVHDLCRHHTLLPMQTSVEIRQPAANLGPKNYFQYASHPPS